jgi:hypothetical protein
VEIVLCQLHVKLEAICDSQRYGKGEERIELVPGQWEFRIPRIALVGPLLALDWAVIGVLNFH